MNKETKAAPAEEADVVEKTNQEIWNEFRDADTAALDGDAADDDDLDEIPDDDGEDLPDDDPDDSEVSRETADDAEKPEEKAEEAPDLDALKEQNSRLEAQLKSEQGRSIGQQRRADRMKKELDELKKRRESRAPDTNDEDTQELESVAEEYSDVVGPLVRKINELNELKSRQNEDLSALELNRLDSLQGDLDDLQDAEFSKLTAEHPEGLDFVKQHADVFREWIQDQPKRHRDVYASNLQTFNDGLGAAWLVSEFKTAVANATNADGSTENELQNRKREKQLRGAKSMKSNVRQNPTPDVGGTEGSSRADDWKYFERLEQKKKAAARR